MEGKLDDSPERRWHNKWRFPKEAFQNTAGRLWKRFEFSAIYTARIAHEKYFSGGSGT